MLESEALGSRAPPALEDRRDTFMSLGELNGVRMPDVRFGLVRFGNDMNPDVFSFGVGMSAGVMPMRAPPSYAGESRPSPPRSGGGVGTIGRWKLPRIGSPAVLPC